ncbi:MAG: alpha/beta hydrolase [Pyrinomonadaceae bacterium]|jgi:pimeloyl-ACP methyl ester carboxylesterase|nr:alpha/beta hydrolase [Pyrinomonadaceae bacterium]
MTEARMRSEWTQVGEHLIHARIFDEDVPAPSVGVTPIVLVHGLGVSGRYMLPTARLLAKHAHVYVPDLPGFGKSSKPSHTLEIRELADVLGRWMMAINLPRAHFIANSFGCQVVAEYALRHREQIERIVFTAPAVDSSARRWQQQILSLLNDALHEPLSMAFIAVTDYYSAGLKRAWRTLQMALRDRIEEKLPHINIPALVVRGELDPLAPHKWCQEVAQALPCCARLATIPNAAHAINYNVPEELAEIVLPFLNAQQ